jgi:hypothetical protein
LLLFKSFASSSAIFVNNQSIIFWDSVSFSSTDFLISSAAVLISCVVSAHDCVSSPSASNIFCNSSPFGPSVDTSSHGNSQLGSGTISVGTSVGTSIGTSVGNAQSAGGVVSCAAIAATSSILLSASVGAVVPSTGAVSGVGITASGTGVQVSVGTHPSIYSELKSGSFIVIINHYENKNHYYH